MLIVSYHSRAEAIVFLLPSRFMVESEFKESGNVPILSEDMALCKFYIVYSFALFISTFSIVDRMNAQLADYLYLL